MNDDQVQEPEETTEEPKGVPIVEIWQAYYDRVLLNLIGNTVNKADKQQYRLKAADIALHLTNLSIRL